MKARPRRAGLPLTVTNWSRTPFVAAGHHAVHRRVLQKESRRRNAREKRARRAVRWWEGAARCREGAGPNPLILQRTPEFLEQSAHADGRADAFPETD